MVSTSSQPQASTSSLPPPPPTTSSRKPKRKPKPSSRPSSSLSQPSHSHSHSHPHPHPPPPDSTIKTCEALTRTSTQCTSIVVGGLKGKVSRQWCEIHEMEERVVREEFDRCLNALHSGTPTIDLSSLPLPRAILRSTELDELATAEERPRELHGWLTNAIESWDYYLSHFGSAVMGDAGVRERLGGAREEVGKILLLISQKSYSLILLSEDALWLVPLPPLSCTLSPLHSPSPPLPPPTAPPLPTPAEEPNPVLALQKNERSTLLELLSLTGSHASFIRDQGRSTERVRIVECLFRRICGGEGGVGGRAWRGGWDHVLRFFEDPTACTIEELRRIHAALMRTDVGKIGEAVMDAFRAIRWEESSSIETEPGEEGVGLQLLGGWIYKNPWKGGMGWREWGHVYDLCGCPTCALLLCTSFDEFALIRRLTVVHPTSGVPPYLFWGEEGESEEGRCFRAVDWVVCQRGGGGGGLGVGGGGGGSGVGEGGGGEKGGGKGNGGGRIKKCKEGWEEREERCWIWVKLSLKNSHAHTILTALSTTHTLLVRSRTSRTTSPTLLTSFPTPPPSQLWLSRHRTSSTRPTLPNQPWILSHPFGPLTTPSQIHTALNSLDTPEKSQSLPEFIGVLEVLILDNSNNEGGFEKFESGITRVICEGVGVGGVRECREWSGRESVKRGEMVVDGRNGKVKEVKEGKARRGMDGMRDDKLAFRLSRGLFT